MKHADTSAETLKPQDKPLTPMRAARASFHCADGMSYKPGGCAALKSIEDCNMLTKIIFTQLANLALLSAAMTLSSGAYAQAAGGAAIAPIVIAPIVVTAPATNVGTFAPAPLNLTKGWNLLGNGNSEPINVASTFGDAGKIATVWTWNRVASKWAFYAPSLSSAALITLARDKDYDVLTSIAPKEGFWVNASTDVALAGSAASAVALVEGDLQPGWNLLGNGDGKTPSQLNEILGSRQNSTGNEIVTAWEWDALKANWKFYAPSLEEAGGTALPDYIRSKGFLAFGTVRLPGDGMWLNILPPPRGRNCDQAAVLDKEGKVVFPVGATEIEESVLVDEESGLLTALYPGLDTTTDAFYADLPCEPSIGGTLPADTPIAQTDLDAEEFVSKFETDTVPEIVKHLSTDPLPLIKPLETLVEAGCYVMTPGTGTSPGTKTLVSCNDPVFLNSAMPFEGRDIIYVHGLEMKHLNSKLNDRTGPASGLWPQDAAAFLNAGGYFRTVAEDYWRPHITEHLTAGWEWVSGSAPSYVPKANRYLLVAWSSNQSIEYAQHTLLTQIQMAIASSKNVVTPPNYPSKTQERPFCANGCIIIGHSTGPLIASSAMGLARAGFYGDTGVLISRKMVAHVSFDGAISGSRVASAGMAVAMAAATTFTALAPGFPGLCPVVEMLFGSQQACTADLSFVANSILRDLIPAVSQGVWGAAVNNSPVPTVTFAGGHPTGTEAGGLMGFLLPGVDDGVVTMNSACGNPNPVFPGATAPSGFTAINLLKAFEFSESNPRLRRGEGLFIAQKNLSALPPGPFYLAGGCTPSLSASGMVMPVSYAWDASVFDARKRFANHYSFMQSVAEHSYDGGGSTPNSWPSISTPAGLATAPREYFGKVFPGSGTSFPGINVEESRAVTDGSIYTRVLDQNGTHLAKHLDMREFKRGRKVSFRFVSNILGNCEKKGSFNWRCTKWLWKRTYNLADKWEQKQASHYAYEFIGRR